MSLVSNNAFAWLNGVDLSQYIGKYLVIIDSNNKSVQGWIKAAGSGETLGSQQAPMSCCTDPDDDQNTIGEGYAGWLPYNSAMLTSELGGVTGRCLNGS